VVKVKLGARYRSQVCATEVVVVKAPPDEVDLTCGGQPMATAGAAEQLTADPALLGGTVIGKRYTDGATIELLVVKPGAGTLAVAGTPLSIKEAKPLPSSD
jgi:hypothetical protein